MNLLVNPQITEIEQDVNGDIKALKLGADKEDAWANIAEQGASAKLENNKAATINVSTYTEPVEVTPTSGKDGMKKATITLSHVPQVQSNKAQTIDVSQYTEPVEIEPTSPNDAMAKATVTLSNIPSGSAEPSLDYPSWLTEGDEFNSIVPNGVKVVGINSSNDSETIETGDGTSKLDMLIGGDIFNKMLVSYGDSIVYTYTNNM